MSDNLPIGLTQDQAVELERMLDKAIDRVIEEFEDDYQTPGNVNVIREVSHILYRMAVGFGPKVLPHGK